MLGGRKCSSFESPFLLLLVVLVIRAVAVLFAWGCRGHRPARSSLLSRATTRRHTGAYAYRAVHGVHPTTAVYDYLETHYGFEFRPRTLARSSVSL